MATKLNKKVKPATEPEITVEVAEEEVTDEVVDENDVTMNVEVAEEEVEATVDTENVTKPRARMVRIKMRENHSCTIGKERYNLEKGVTYNVPAFVKDVLAKRDLLVPLN